MARRGRDGVGDQLRAQPRVALRRFGDSSTTDGCPLRVSEVSLLVRTLISTDISDLAIFDRSHPTPTRLRFDQDSAPHDLASQNPPNCRPVNGTCRRSMRRRCARRSQPRWPIWKRCSRQRMRRSKRKPANCYAASSSAWRFRRARGRCGWSAKSRAWCAPQGEAHARRRVLPTLVAGARNQHYLQPWRPAA